MAQTYRPCHPLAMPIWSPKGHARGDGREIVLRHWGVVFVKNPVNAAHRDLPNVDQSFIDQLLYKA